MTVMCSLSLSLSLTLSPDITLCHSDPDFEAADGVYSGLVPPSFMRQSGRHSFEVKSSDPVLRFVSAGIVNVAVASPDVSAPPARVEDLKVTEVTDEFVYFEWTAVGDELHFGRGESSQCRYSFTDCESQIISTCTPSAHSYILYWNENSTRRNGTQSQVVSEAAENAGRMMKTKVETRRLLPRHDMSKTFVSVAAKSTTNVFGRKSAPAMVRRPEKLEMTAEKSAAPNPAVIVIVVVLATAAVAAVAIFVARALLKPDASAANSTTTKTNPTYEVPEEALAMVQ
jgi:hypothetical protein